MVGTSSLIFATFRVRQYARVVNIYQRALRCWEGDSMFLSLHICIYQNCCWYKEQKAHLKKIINYSIFFFSLQILCCTLILSKCFCWYLFFVKLFDLQPTSGCNRQVKIVSTGMFVDRSEMRYAGALFISDVCDFFADSDNSIQILEEYFLKFLCYSQCHS